MQIKKRPYFQFFLELSNDFLSFTSKKKTTSKSLKTYKKVKAFQKSKLSPRNGSVALR